MSKELTLAEKFSNVWIKLYADDEIREFLTCEECKVMNEVKTALKEWEEDNTFYHREYDKAVEYISHLESSISELKNNKQLKVLEIIKDRLIFNFNDKAKAIFITRKNCFMHITLFFDKQEEFDLLKEVLQ